MSYLFTQIAKLFDPSAGSSSLRLMSNPKRLLSLAMVPVFLLSSMSPQLVFAQAKNKCCPSVAANPVPIQSKTSDKKLVRIEPKLNFSPNPSDLQLKTARIFSEPLLPCSGPTNSAENTDLSQALLAYRAKNDPEDVSDLKDFVSSHPSSRWNATVELNMALTRFISGHLSEAMGLLKSAYERSKNETGEAKSVADRAITKLLLINSRLGREDALKALFNEVKGRKFGGSDEEMFLAANQGLAYMTARPDKAFKCGPLAVNSLVNLKKPHYGCTDLLLKAKSTDNGSNMSQVQEWAKESGLNLQVAKRAPGAPLIAPAVFHWKENHFAAITCATADSVTLEDPTFDSDRGISMKKSTLNEESDGYFLVPSGPLPTGWTAVSSETAKTIWGKGYTTWTNKGAERGGICSGGDCAICKLLAGCGGIGGGGTGSGGSGASGGSSGGGGSAGGSSAPAKMAQTSTWILNAAANIQDTPVSYSPPIGRRMDMHVNFSDDEINQPSTFAFTNFGLNWSFNWLSYLTIDPGTSAATIRMPSGGSDYEALVSGAYLPDRLDQGVLTNPSSGVYNRTLPDGTVWVYNQPDGTGRIFMSQIIDPQGHTESIQYDANFRITSITDAINQVSTISYVSNTIGNSGFYKVSTITDPFGRSASFAYDSTNTYLTSVTDCIGLKSAFTYDTSTSDVASITTPYGVTTFSRYTPTTTVPSIGLKVTMPDKSTYIYENWAGEPKTSYFWSREVLATYPSDPARHDFSHAQSAVWIDNGGLQDPCAIYVKNPLEAGKTYNYPFQVPGPVSNVIYRPQQILQSIETQSVVFTIGGTPTVGDYLAIGINYVGNHGFGYTVQTGDTLNSIATGLANRINNPVPTDDIPPNTAAIANGATVTLTTQGQNVDFEVDGVYGAGTETMAVAAAAPQVELFTAYGTPTTGDNLSINFSANNIGNRTELYTVLSTDTLSSIMSAFASIINSDSYLTSRGFSAVSNGAVLTVTNNWAWAVTTTAWPVLLFGNLPLRIQKRRFEEHRLSIQHERLSEQNG